MTDAELAIRRAIIADPDDDLPRLAFADFLRDRDRPGDWDRAEFIAVQCELARGMRVGRRAAKLRGLRLFRRHEREWFRSGPLSVGWVFGADDRLARVAERVGVGYGAVARGFVGSVRGPLAAFWADRECGRCSGFSVLPTWPELACECRNTGRTSGPAPAFAGLCRIEPVTAVAVSDLAPSDTPSGWAWRRHTGPDDTDTPPPALFDRLAAVPGPLLFPRERVAYPTAADATSALSTALIAAARGPAHALTPAAG